MGEHELAAADIRHGITKHVVGFGMLILDILGLLMNFVGAILLYVYGVAGTADASGPARDKQQFMAGIGVALLIAGFFLQLVGHTITGVEEWRSDSTVQVDGQ